MLRQTQCLPRFFVSLTLASCLLWPSSLTAQDQASDSSEKISWKTNTQFPPEGSPQAVKGGAIRYWVGDFPTTLRFIGKDSNSVTNSLIESMCFERLLMIHSDTLEFMPNLAINWAISEDRRTFHFRLNPRARWSDGKPVVAADVVATYDLMMDDGLLDPALQVVYGKFERPTAISKDVVQVKAKDLNWRNFLYFAASMAILPAHEIQGMEGGEFLRKYQFKLPVNSGPYQVLDSDIKRGDHFTFRRRKNYWGYGERFATGLYNFDLIRCVSTPDYLLAFERAKKGEIDIFQVLMAKQWVEDVPQLPLVQRGVQVARRIYNDEPVGTQGIAFNMRVPPVNDVRVRKALAYALDRGTMIEKLMYNEYKPLDTYFGGLYQNPDNELVRFDLGKAEELLIEAGYQERGSDGYRVKDGRPLQIELMYSSEASARFLTVYQEDLKRLGVKLDLKYVTPATAFQAAYGDRNFVATTQSWTGLIFPNPETSWLSSLAEAKNNNNITGFKSPRVDELCDQYDEMFTVAERVKAIREVDGLVFREHPYVLFWYLDNIRLLHANRFGMPEWGLGRTSREDSALALWWIDPEKDKQFKAAQANSSLKMEPGPQELRYWRDRQPADRTGS